MAHVIDQIPEVEREEFNRIGYTIGGMMIFPANQVDRKPTINGARGLDAWIADRFDLTVECIRRHYLDEPSPLSSTLARYADFFGLFGDFAGYVDFFLLQDLVNEVTSTVEFFTPFEDFTGSPLPGTLDAYLGYRQLAIEFIDRATGGSPLTTARAGPSERMRSYGQPWSPRPASATREQLEVAALARGARLRKEMVKQRFDALELSEVTSVLDRTTIYRIRRGETLRPRYWTIAELAGALRVRPRWLMDGGRNKSTPLLIAGR